ncbi:hypothetical protein [Brevibacterium ihuae]|uniref:hypothetical protein n=1 Tax=Brevibacterium ihuae TaxID=1631743 RepID=UPI000C78E659|nr:hypothetical protein [Brevibacterium ihuae]
MIIECTHPGHGIDPAGVVSCPDPECLVAAVHSGPDPMSRLPDRRPEWILACPDRLDHAEVEALAILGDAGLVPQIVAPDHADRDLDYVPFAPAVRRVG